MATQYIKRTSTPFPTVSGAHKAPIYVDSDDNKLKMIPAGSGTTEVDIADVSSTQTFTNKTLTSPVVGGDLGVNDDVSLELGTDDDSVLRHKSATLAANTALTDVFIGTPVIQALAANSTIVSNVTASGDIVVAANRGGASEEYFFADASAGTLTLTGPGGVINFESGATQVLGINSATVIEVGDDINLTLGADNDGVLRHKTTSTNANTAVTGVIVGTPIVPALAANSVVLSNITADGDIAIITQTGGNSQAALTVDASANQLDLYAAGASKLIVDATGVRAVAATEVVATTNVITAVESGKTFFLDLAGGFTSTLPAPTAGQFYKFIVKTAPTTAYVITTNAGDNVLQGTVANNGAETEANGIDLANHDTINFVASQAKVGDFVEMISDGTNWYVSGMVQDFANLTVAVT